MRGRGERTESASETNPCGADRGRTDRRADMEGSTGEEYKEKLLWNVKREVGPALLYICAASFIGGASQSHDVLREHDACSPRAHHGVDMLGILFSFQVDQTAAE